MAKAQFTVGDLRGMNRSDLEARITDLKEELFNLRFQAATGQLESPARMRSVRKEIARIYTIIQERNLGIVTDPDIIEEA